MKNSYTGRKQPTARTISKKIMGRVAKIEENIMGRILRVDFAARRLMPPDEPTSTLDPLDVRIYEVANKVCRAVEAATVLDIRLQQELGYHEPLCVDAPNLVATQHLRSDGLDKLCDANGGPITFDVILIMRPPADQTLLKYAGFIQSVSKISNKGVVVYAANEKQRLVAAACLKVKGKFKRVSKYPLADDDGALIIGENF